MKRTELREYARIGAEVRLEELRQEAAAILKKFFELRSGRLRHDSKASVWTAETRN
jgi:hypothetical protein